MSDINLDFTVSNNSINFTVEPNDITFTPTDIQLSFYTTAAPIPAGTTGQLQYNNNGVLGGANNTSFSAGNLTLAVADTKITGGNNHYYLQTDGTGNLTWAVGTGNMQGNGTVAGANTQIQFNDGGANFGGNAGFTFNKVNGNVDIPGNLIVVGNISANNITGNANYANFAGTAFNVSGSNVSGQVANALVAGTVYTNAQPNITSVGTLSSLSVTGNISAQSFAGALGSLPYGLENISLIGAQTGTYNMDLISNAINYSTANATSNVTLNFRGNSSVTANTLIANGQSVTSTYVMTNGTTPYGITGIQVDGVSQTIKWAGGLTPTSYANTTVSSTFTIIKTSTTPTYVVLGSSTRYS